MSATKGPLRVEDLLSTVARLLKAHGAAREIALLTDASATLEHSGYDNWNGGVDFWDLRLLVPPNVFAQLDHEQRTASEEAILKAASPCFSMPGDSLGQVHISPALIQDEKWREKARNWLSGAGVTNQGRVRSDNIAARQHDGLLFRSAPEILLYRALKSSGVSFAPLPVFIRGGESYRRIEPDFVILKDGVVLVVEVDGDTVHEETPVEAHARTTMLLHEGAHLERISAAECDTEDKARAAAQRLLTILRKHATNRG